MKLSVVSVFSFSSKAVLVFLKMVGTLQDGSSLYLSMSTLIVEAVPSFVTIVLLIQYHRRSLTAARGLSGTSPVDMGANLLASFESNR